MELLAALGVRHEVVPPREPELALGRLPPAEHVQRSALAKAREVAFRQPNRAVLGADTVVALGPAPGDVLGKPADARDAARMLRSLSGREHEVLTGVAVVAPSGRAATRVALTRVAFAPLPEELISRYVETGEPLDKAGAYAVQGLIASHVESLTGSWSNVVGLPQEMLDALFRDVGLRLSLFQGW